MGRTTKNDKELRALRAQNARKHPEYLPEETITYIQGMAGYGLTVRDIAAILGMSKATLERYYAKQPEVHEALVRGRALQFAKIAKTGANMAADGKHPQMTMFWLRCRGNGQFNDRRPDLQDWEDSQGGSGGAELEAMKEISNLSDDELQGRIEALEMELRNGSYKVAE